MSDRLDLPCDFEPNEKLIVENVPCRKLIVFSLGNEDLVISHYLTYSDAKKLKDWLTENIPKSTK